HMSCLLCLHICFHHHHNIEHLSKLFMPESQLVHVGLYPFLNRCGLSVCRGNVPIVELLAIFAMWSTPRIGARIGKIQRRIMPQLRHQMQTHVSDHVHGIIMAQLTIKKKVHDLASITNLLQQALNVLLEKTQRWAESHLPTVAMLAPLGTPPLP